MNRRSLGKALLAGGAAMMAEGQARAAQKTLDHAAAAAATRSAPSSPTRARADGA